MYELFEHTADVGIRVEAPELERLFAEAGKALFAVIAGGVEAVAARSTRSVSLEAEEIDELLHDWLTRLLVLLDVDGLLLCDFEVSLEGTRLTALVHGEPADPERHDLRREVKAVTYHGLVVEPTAFGWRAEVILDI